MQSSRQLAAQSVPQCEGAQLAGQGNGQHSQGFMRGDQEGGPYAQAHPTAPAWW